MYASMRILAVTFFCCTLLQFLQINHGYFTLMQPRLTHRISTMPKIMQRRLSQIVYSNEENANADLSSAKAGESGAIVPVPEVEETPQEKARREKQEQIQELKAKEVFVTRNTGRYECQACGYVYDEAKGYTKRGVAPGTPFDDIEKFRCPQCGANKKYFVPETETLSGFKENLKYGLGTNSLTGGQKSLLIFGGLFLGFAVFMSGYLLE